MGPIGRPYSGAQALLGALGHIWNFGMLPVLSRALGHGVGKIPGDVGLMNLGYLRGV